MEGERNRAPSHSSTAQLCPINNLWVVVYVGMWGAICVIA